MVELGLLSGSEEERKMVLFWRGARLSGSVPAGSTASLLDNCMARSQRDQDIE